MSWLKKLLRIRYALLLMVVLAFTILFTSNYGLRQVVQLANVFLPGKVELVNLQGALNKNIHVEKLQYRDQSLLIQAENVSFSFSLWKLLKGKIAIRQLAAQTLVIKQLNPFPPSESSDFHAPKHLQIDALTLPKITYYSLADKPVVVGHLLLSGNQDKMHLNFVSDTPFATKITGLYDRSSQSPLHLLATWQAIPKFTVQQPYQITQGQLTIDGDLETWRAQLETHVKSELISNSLLTVSLHHQDKNIYIDNGLWALPKGKLKLTGLLSHYTNWDAKLTGVDFDPGQFVKTVAGKIHFVVHGSGDDLTLPGIKRIHLSELSGLWHDLPVRAEGEFLHQNANDWQIKQVQFNLAENRCQVHGGYHAKWDLNWQCKFNHLNQLSTDLHGDLLTHGSLQGSGENARVDGVITSQLFQFQKLNMQQLQAKLQGQLSHHSLQASWKSFAKQNSIDLQGHWLNKRWRGDITQLVLVVSEQLWTLDNKAHIELGENSKLSSPLCIHNQKQRACLELTGNAKKWSTHLTLRQVQLAPWLQFFSVPIDASSICDLNLQLNGLGTTTTGDLHATLSATPVVIHNKNQDYSVQLQNATINATLTKNGLQSQIHAVANQKDQFDAKVGLPNFRIPLSGSLLEQPVTGEANVALVDISWISSWIKQLQDVKGQILGHLQMAGTLAKPKITGNASLEHFNSELNDLGLHLQEGQIHATPSAAGIIVNGSVKSGDGILNIHGTIPMLLGNTAYQLNLTGNNILIANTKNYKVWANSDLQFKLDANGFNLTGLLTIPKANANPDDFSNTIEMPQEVKFTDAKVPTNPSLPFSTDIQLQLGDAVNINTHGLTGLLRGKLHIVSPANQPITVATGTLTVDKGFYNAYGQQLILEKSELLYTGGDILNPGMSIQAYKNVRGTPNSAGDKPINNLFANVNVLGFDQENIRVGVKVTGTASNPKVDLYSQPPGISSSDILSYLILNQPLSQVSRDNASSLLGAVGAFALSGQNSNGSIYRDIQKKLGLDDFSLTTMPNNLQQKGQEGFAPTNAAVSIGKALSPKFHVHYIQSITTPIGMLQLQYLLTQRLTLQVESSQQSQAFDILFTKER